MRARYVAKGHRGLLITNWQECQATRGRKHCGSYCSLAANYSGGQTNVAHSPRSSWSFNLRKSGLSMHPAAFNRKASARPLMMSTATGERGPNQPKNYGKKPELHTKPRWQQTNVRKNIRRANFAIYFWGFKNIPLCKFRNRLLDFRMSFGAAGKTGNTHLR